MIHSRWIGVAAVAGAALGCPHGGVECPGSLTDAGSPDFQCAGVTAVSLATLEANLLQPSCATTSCHVPGGIAPTDWSTVTSTASYVGKPSKYATPSDPIQIIDPSNLTNSAIWLKPLGGSPPYFTDTCASVGGIMPYGAAERLPAAELDLIKGWICSGAPAQ